MAIRVGVNGFGRIGRQVLKAIMEYYPDDIEVVAFNDLGDLNTMAHLFRYDSNYGVYPGAVEATDGALIVDGNEIKALSERDPAQLPWGEMGVDVVIESTGIFTDKASASKHIAAGAKKVIISAPAKGEDLTIVLGVNQDWYDPAQHHVLSNASCTTNCLAPAAKVVNDVFGIKQGFMTTIHSYTNDQQILDLPHKDLRRARAAAVNMIPTSTGAAQAVALVVPELKGKFDGMAVRVPTPTGSLVDFVASVERAPAKDELIDSFEEAAAGPMRGYLDVSHEPLVSSDYVGNPHSSVIDALATDVAGDLVKVITWYDNEWGYSCRTADLTKFVGDRL
ncbi:MAG: type I glyceraldehyde-3-phosphate dehydrogenase [Chloroflexota bacterium]|nr:type I glyceraldehyde-3-phosphate dehydrogenase [Chloroflexota bacterium]MDE2855627.1 type I glyceraldehyde-3-phosphate dehydrogenase [Chloroflexota bacterium]MDE2946339.1 type I glyceraldehyde-3-phosphate dehydrogenase [Chloroflexota bacterium]